MTIDWAMALSLETQNGTPVFRLQISHICLRDMESSVGWLCRHSDSHVFKESKIWNFKDSTCADIQKSKKMELQGFNMCVCAFVGVLSDMESSVGWLCRHSSDNQIMFLCVCQCSSQC